MGRGIRFMLGRSTRLSSISETSKGAKPMSQQNDSKPIKTFRVGSISAAVFRNETKKQGKTLVRYSAQIQKQFRKEDGSWHQTQTFFPEDLPRLQLVTAKSFEFICLKESKDSGESIPV
jgi:hypothetical protein